MLLLVSIHVFANHQVEGVLKLGVVPQFDPRRIEQIWQPIIIRVQARSGIRLELVGSPSIPEFEKQFERGEFDLAYMNPYHLLIAHRSQGYEPLLRDVARKLYGIIVVRRDSNINDIGALNNKQIAFPAPNALGAALIPRTEFGEKYKLRIQPLYVNSHTSVYLNVVTGETEAGGGVLKTLQKQNRDIQQRLKIIYKTPQVNPHPLAIHPRVQAAVRTNLLNAFLQIGQSTDGKRLLSQVPINKIGQASLADYENLRHMGLDKYYIKE